MEQNNVTKKTSGAQVAQLLRNLFPNIPNEEWREDMENGLDAAFKSDGIGNLYITDFDDMGEVTMDVLINAMKKSNINPAFVLYTRYWGKFSLCIANYDETEITF